jgi:hypothetical protein
MVYYGSFESESGNSFLRFLASKQDNFGGWANNVSESPSYHFPSCTVFV